MTKRIKKNINKRANAINTLFFILMGLMFIGIIYFGMSKIFFLEDEISEQEMQLLKLDIEKAITYCEDPLNKGSNRKLDVTSNKFNLVCLLDEDIVRKFGSNSDVDIIYSGGDNVILLSGFYLSEDDFTYQNYNLISSFKIDFLKQPEGKCWFENQNNILEMELMC